jgi:hypothetical protein
MQLQNQQMIHSDVTHFFRTPHLGLRARNPRTSQNEGSHKARCLPRSFNHVKLGTTIQV